MLNYAKLNLSNIMLPFYSYISVYLIPLKLDSTSTTTAEENGTSFL